MKHARKDYDRIQDPDGKIPEDEPVFIVRAQDICAGDTVRAWAALNDDIGGDPISSTYEPNTQLLANLALLAEIASIYYSTGVIGDVRDV